MKIIIKGFSLDFLRNPVMGPVIRERRVVVFQCGVTGFEKIYGIPHKFDV